jgi:hypothetical protein
MALANYPLSCSQNEDRTWVLGFAMGTVANPIGPYSFAGCTAELQVRQSQDSASALLLTLSTTLGSIVLGGPTTINGISCGTVTVTITHAQSVLLPQGKLYYDLLITTAGGLQSYYLAGDFNVTATGSR